MEKDRKILIKFIITVILALCAGMAVGFCSTVFEKDISGLMAFIFEGIVKISPVLMAFSFVFMAFAFRYFRKGKYEAGKAVLSDDDELYEKADESLEKALCLTMYMTIYSFGVLGVILSGFSGLFEFSDFVKPMTAVLMFLVCLFTGVFLQSEIVKQIKILNPGKKGNTMDTKFEKEWFESCDEAEKAIIGFAAYESYKATNKAIVAVWLVTALANTLLPIGPLPAICVTVIWFVQYYTYTKAAKENKHK